MLHAVLQDYAISAKTQGLGNALMCVEVLLCI